MADADTYLQLRNWRRFQHYRDRRPPWVKLYVELLDDDVMTGLPAPTQLLAIKLLLLAARMDNLIPNDPRRIAGWTLMRRRDVTVGLAQLHRSDYIEVISRAQRLPDGSLQLPIAAAQPRAGNGDGASTIASTVASSLASAHARPRTRGEAEAETETDLSARQTSTENHARDALPFTPNGRDPVLLGRLIGLGARGDERSAAIIRHEAAGLPEHALARCAESLLGRRPRPANPAGYVVATLKSIRAELGIAPTATIDREPDL